MNADNTVWMTILGYMTLAITISVITSVWIRHHLKHKLKSDPDSDARRISAAKVLYQKTGGPIQPATNYVMYNGALTNRPFQRSVKDILK